MKKNLDFVTQIQSGLETLNGISNPHAAEDFIIASEKRNALLISEIDREADVAICLQKEILQKFSETKLPTDFNLEVFPELSIVIEELSHFNTYCIKATQDESVSALELEVQAEVDKFGLALGWLEQRNEFELREKVYDLLFKEVQIGSWVKDSELARYAEAHLIAKNFCKQILQSGSTVGVQEKFQKFFALPLSDKLTSKF
ncbi:MAG: hypothetical protein J0L93_02415 [Deltaproteobacteria bacterium]|nr:hypothetical protein [Deltaproteobacteria bacterium]